MLLVGALVTAPSVESWLTIGSSRTARIFESSVFGVDYGYFFDQIWYGHSLWLWGQYITNGVNYAPLYALYYFLGAITGSGSSAYHLSLVGFQLLSVCSLAAFLRAWQLNLAPDRVRMAFDQAVPWILGLLFVTSLANFNYLKSTVMFELPYYSLPIQLYLADRYVRDGFRAAFAGIAITALLMNSGNATFFLYVEGMLAGYLVFARLQQPAGAPKAIIARDLSFLGFALLPAAMLIFIATAVNVPYYGTLDEVATIMVEGMYSMNATMQNILSLTTDWGLFDGFNGEAYYEFGGYYRRLAIRLVALIVVLMPLLLASARVRRASASFYLWWAAVAVFCIFMQLGSNNPIYRWLLENVFVFQVFRNITKLTPGLVLSLLAIVFYRVTLMENERLRRAAFAVFVAASVVYNLPFWTYADYFLRDRSAAKIPEYWAAAGNWMEANSTPDSRVLLMPATYVNDIYLWDGKKSWVQGTLPDGVWKQRTFRLSEGFVGAPPMQQQMRRLLVSDPLLPRGIGHDYDALERFLARYGFDLIVLNLDLVSEYDRISEIRAWLERAAYKRVALMGRLEIFSNPAMRRSAISADADMTVSQIDHLTYRLHFNNIRHPVTVTFEEPYRNGWSLALDRQGEDCASNCPRSPLLAHWDDVRLAIRPEVAQATHSKGMADGNSWRVDPAEVAQLDKAGDVTKRPDDSLSFTLTLHFKPQLYFVVTFWAFMLSCLTIALLFLIVPFLRRFHLERTLHRYKAV